MSTIRPARPASSARRTLSATLAAQGLTALQAASWLSRWSDRARQIILQERLAGRSAQAAGAALGLSGVQATRVTEEFLTLAGAAQRGDPNALRAFTPPASPGSAPVDLDALDALLRQWRTLERTRLSYQNAAQCSVTLRGQTYGVQVRRADGQATLLGAVLTAADERGWAVEMHVDQAVTATVTAGPCVTQITAATRLEAVLEAYLRAVRDDARAQITAR